MQYNNVFAFFALTTNAGAENTLKNKILKFLHKAKGLHGGGERWPTRVKWCTPLSNFIISPSGFAGVQAPRRPTRSS